MTSRSFQLLWVICLGGVVGAVGRKRYPPPHELSGSDPTAYLLERECIADELVKERSSASCADERVDHSYWHIVVAIR